MAPRQTFDTLHDAQSYVSSVVDQPITANFEALRPGITLAQSAIQLEGGRFTNSYDLAFNSQDAVTNIVAFKHPTSVHDYMQAAGAKRPVATCSGGFFYLADIAKARPRQLALNLSISGDRVRSLPVVDREAVIASRNGLEMRSLAALGALSINDHEISWSGSFTPYETEAKIFSNGNAVIRHEARENTGQARILDESSRFTPPIFDQDYVDVGYVGRGKNEFKAVAGSTNGKLNIFSFDFVVRCPRKYLEKGTNLQVCTIGNLALDSFRGGAFSAGPDLFTDDFTSHPINQDASLGSHPPFTDAYHAQTALYQTSDGMTHLRLFDGRPGSHDFPGITPNETVNLITLEQDLLWGCFLDPGQTAKLCITRADGIDSYGNRHYMRWPNSDNNSFAWVPESGRPIANVITVQ